MIFGGRLESTLPGYVEFILFNPWFVAAEHCAYHLVNDIKEIVKLFSIYTWVSKAITVMVNVLFSMLHLFSLKNVYSLTCLGGIALRHNKLVKS